MEDQNEIIDERIMKNKIKQSFIDRYFDDDSKEKYEHMLAKKEESAGSLKKSMIGHLSALNDGVIAIFITVMMLEIPYPRLQTEVKSFLWSIAVFLVSFFIVAEFWYDNKRIFEAIREADHMVVISNFLFLASLALIPATTKWIMNQNNRYSEITFGIVYFITLMLEQLLYYAAVRERFLNHKALFITILTARIGYLVIINAILMVLAWFYPRPAMLLYLALPILSFFRPDKG